MPGALKVYAGGQEGRAFQAHIPLVPGVNAVRPAREAAVQAALAVLEDEVAFLRGHGFPLPEIPADELTLLDAPATFALPEDFEPLTTDERQRLFDRLALSRQRLLGLVTTLPGERLVSRPGSDWGIREVLEHVATGEAVLVSFLTPVPSEPRRALSESRKALVDRLLTVEEGQWSTCTHFLAVPWTPLKVMRRAAYLQGAWHDHVQAVLDGQEVVPELPNPFVAEDIVGAENLQSGELDANSLVESFLARGAHMDAYLDMLNGEKLARSAPGRTPIAAALTRLATAYWFLGLHLARWPDDVFARLDVTRASVVAQLAELGQEELSRTTTTAWDEPITVRKVFRRLLEHEREHYDQVRTMIATPS